MSARNPSLVLSCLQAPQCYYTTCLTYASWLHVHAGKLHCLLSAQGGTRMAQPATGWAIAQQVSNLGY